MKVCGEGKLWECKIVIVKAHVLAKKDPFRLVQVKIFKSRKYNMKTNTVRSYRN